jgi:putative ABC transport system permease protein
MLRRDFDYALRGLRRQPTFTVTCVATLAFGIGVSAAIFSILNAVLLRPLPYGDSDRLVVITADQKARSTGDVTIPSDDVADVRDAATLLDGAAAVMTLPGVTVDREGLPPERIAFAEVTTNLFDVLKVPMAHGRSFVPADETSPPAPAMRLGGSFDLAQAAPSRAAIISYEFWQRAFGGDPTVIGHNIRVFAVVARIVGVAAPRTELLFPVRFGIERSPDVWLATPDLRRHAGDSRAWRVIARLRTGTTIGAARGQIEAIGAELRRRIAARSASNTHLRLEPMRPYLVADSRRAILALGGAAALVLLIVCANVANLQLLRTAQRERELAVRIALGASPRRVVQPLFVESLLLAGGGALGGIILAKLSLSLLVNLVPWNLPRLVNARIDGAAVLFTVLAGIGAGLVFGLWPAIRMSRRNLLGILHTSRQPSLYLPARVQDMVVIAEVGLSFVLLIGCGLLFRSFAAVSRVDLGYAPNGLVAFGSTDFRMRSFEEAIALPLRLRERLAAIPGVTAVTASLTVPLSGQQPSMLWGPPAAVEDPTRLHRGRYDVVLPGYFAAMHTRVIAGRTFTTEDLSPGSRVVVLDAVAAKIAFGNESPIGKTIVAHWQTEQNTVFSVIGVVAHQRHTTVVGAENESLYLPYIGLSQLNRWLVRTSGDPTKLVSAVHLAMSSSSPPVMMADVRTMNDLVATNSSATRFALAILATFAIAASVVTAIGLYGVLSTLVRQRTVEIAVRMAIGADARSIFGLIIGHGLKLAAIGLGVGTGLAMGGTRALMSLLVGVPPSDPISFAAAAIAFLGVVTVACWLPARRATLLNPNVALRDS